MPNLALPKHFSGMWSRAKALQSLDELTPDLIRSWAEQRGLVIKNLEERDAGVFAPTRSIVLEVDGGIACFPKVPSTGNPEWQLRRDQANRHAALWEKMEWFSPFWIPMGNLSKILTAVSDCTRERAIELFNYHTSTIYTLAFQATCIAQIFPKARSLSNIEPLAREAYLAFYSGYRAAGIASLIPAVEGVLERIVASEGAGLTIPAKIEKSFARAIDYAARQHYEGMWAPSEYLTKEYLFGQDERVYSLETFRRWLITSFFKNTGEYDGVTWLNRHLFAHGVSPDWQQSANFVRLIVALATLGIVDSWHSESFETSLFFPAMDDSSKLLHGQAMLRCKAQSIVLRMEAEHFLSQGHTVPSLPTDDGTLLRKALLSDDCNKDLVRALRDAGWSVNVGEPDDKALYVSVEAVDGDEKLDISLLYSCATSNEIYLKLAEVSNVILYRGGPFHQRTYAHGVDIPVGPVNAWQPPVAPSRKAMIEILQQNS